jgi:transcriptional regulator with XRE-family HTH domain
MDINALPGHFVGAEVRRLRDEAGWTQGELAERTGFSSALVGYIETNQRTITERFAAACDAAFGTGGYLTRLCPLARTFATPNKPLPELLRAAVSLQLADPLLVPPLAWIDDYAKAALTARAVPEDTIGELLKERVWLGDLLEASPNLSAWLIIDETTLYRPVGTTAILRAQLKALIELINTTGRVIAQIIKTTSPTIPLMSQPHFVLGFADGTSLAPVPSLEPGDQTERYTPPDPHLHAFNLLRAAALPPGISQGIIANATR